MTDEKKILPTFYVVRPDGSYSAADPMPLSAEFYFMGDDGVNGAAAKVGDFVEPHCIRHDDNNHELSMRLLTLCVLVLRNGFTVTGESTCASLENFDAEVGRKNARANAIEKLTKSDFGKALEFLKRGHKVTRAGWNGKGMWLSMSGPIEGRKVHADGFWSENNTDYANEQPGQLATVLPCITMKTATGEILMGWLASQTDMLAEDWMLVP